MKLISSSSLSTELMENEIVCEEILAEEVCAALKKAAEKLKIKAAEVDKIVREAVKKGITKATEIAKIVREKLIDLATNFKCEDALSASVSAKIICLKVRIKMRETYCKICNDLISLPAIVDFPLGNPSDIKKLNF